MPATPTLTTNGNTEPTFYTNTSPTLTCDTTTSGEEKIYTFFKESENVQSGASATITLDSLTLSDDSTAYSCQVTVDGVESDESDPVILSVVGKYLPF